MKYLLMFWFFPQMMMMNTCSTTPEEQTVMEDNLDLKYLVREAKDASTEAPLLLLLHGYGSNESDLFSLTQYIPEHWLVVSVQAPNPMGNGQYKWYDVKLVNDKIIMNFTDEESSRKALLHLINQVSKKYQVDQSKVVTAGFSQGANMSLGLALTAPDLVLGAGLFSGRFMKEIKPLITDKSALKGKKIYIAHGSEDTMLPITYADENQELLESWDMNVTRSTDQVAHTISSKHLNEFVTWLNSL